jgi:hypothetical protein
MSSRALQMRMAGLLGLLVLSAGLRAATTSPLPSAKLPYCAHDEQMERFLRGEKFARPTMSGAESIRTGTNITVHWTPSGADACTRAYAESARVAAETSWVRNGRFGFLRPPPDGANGGDAKYDIYVKDPNYFGASGVCVEESPYTTDYPDGYTSYVLIENTFSNWPWLRSLVAHEFSHGCQKRYSQFENDPMRYFYENTSTLMQHLVFADYDQLPGWLGIDTSHAHLTHWGIFTRYGGYHYSGGLWAWFLCNYYDDVLPRTVIRTWDICGNHAGANTRYDTDSTLRRYYSSNLEAAIGHYAVWRYFIGAVRDDGRHFDDGETYPAVSILRSHSVYPTGTQNQGTRGPSVPGGCQFIRLGGFGSSLVNITFNGQDGYKFACYVIGRRGTTSHEYKIFLDGNNDGSITIPGAEYDSIVLIPVTVHWSDTAYNRTYTYSVSLADDGADAALGVATPLDFTISAATSPGRAPIHFELPQAAGVVFRVRSSTGACLRTFANPGATLIWDGCDRQGRRVPAGAYFCELATDDQVVRKKLVLE